jgi:hypothetical protein
MTLDLAMVGALPREAAGWGDAEHAVVTLTAQPFLEPDVRSQVGRLAVRQRR